MIDRAASGHRSGMRLPWSQPILTLPEARILGEIREARGMPAAADLVAGHRRLIDSWEGRRWVIWVDREDGRGACLYTTNDGDLALGAALGVPL